MGKNKMMNNLKTILLIVLSLIPLLGVIAFIIWRVMKRKGKSNNEIQSYLLIIDGLIIYFLALFAFLIASFATGDEIGWIILGGWVIIGIFILLIFSAVNSKKHPQGISLVPVIKDKRFIPKCPVCGSPNVQKIHIASKIVDGAMFGLFSKTATSQFECNNCKYKF